MSVVYISSLEAGKECLQLIQKRTQIDYIVTIDRQIAERAKVSGYTDFSKMGIPTRYVTQYPMNNEVDCRMIQDLAPRLIIVNGWNRLLPKPVLKIPTCGCIGFHGSWNPLPFGRGRSPVSWSILNGQTQFFVHLFYLDEGIDSGDIIDTVRFDITPDDTCATVLGKVGIVSARMLIDNVPKILAGIASRTPQSGTPTYLPKLTVQDGIIDWTMPMHKICNLVRAFTSPYGGAFTDIHYRGKSVRMHIWDATPFSTEIKFEGDIGTIVHELHGKPLIKCKDGAILVKDFSTKSNSRLRACRSASQSV